MSDLGKASSVLGVQILRYRTRCFLSLSKKSYINQLKGFNMNNCSAGEATIVKGDRFSKSQSPKSETEKELVKLFPTLLLSEV